MLKLKMVRTESQGQSRVMPKDTSLIGPGNTAAHTLDCCSPSKMNGCHSRCSSSWSSEECQQASTSKEAAKNIPSSTMSPLEEETLEMKQVVDQMRRMDVLSEDSESEEQIQQQQRGRYLRWHSENTTRGVSLLRESGAAQKPTRSSRSRTKSRQRSRQVAPASIHMAWPRKGGPYQAGPGPARDPQSMAELAYLEERQGVIDLGFEVTDTDEEEAEVVSGPRSLPVLQVLRNPLRRQLSDSQGSPVSPLDRGAWRESPMSSPGCRTPPEPWKVVDPGASDAEMKLRLKFWAQAVASTVKMFH